MKLRYTVFCVVVLVSHAFAQEYLHPWRPGGTYEPTVPSPDSVLGFPLAQKPARYDQVVAYFARLASASARVRRFAMGETYEKRQQYYLVISSPENIARLDDIRRDIGRLADPRTLSTDAAKSLAKSVPAVVWIGYGIHGDEFSSVDAALFVAYQLAAGTDTQTKTVLQNVLVCIDPSQNPDGRERFLAQMEQWASVRPSSDAQSMQHTGMWPYGRGNHYLFDLNRDWISLVHPEIRQRVQAAAQWNPQVFIDSHEMGAFDTYLFSPPREPINPHMGAHISKWWQVFSADQAKAFDRYGWSYYTREWNDEWYPGYSNSWAMHNDAVGILYEQAGVEGTLVKRPDGTTLTYRETVHHHIVSSLANLSTAAAHRLDLLTDFHAAKREAMKAERGEARVFYLPSGENRSRVDRLVHILLSHGIEIYTADREIPTAELRACWGEKAIPRTLPRGTFVIPADQPRARIVRVVFDCDPRMSTAFLQEERKSLEKEKNSKLYDITGWGMPLAYGVAAYWSGSAAAGPLTRISAVQEPEGRVENVQATYGFLLPYSDDRATQALACILQKGLKARAAKEPFSVGGQSFDRGTILLRRNENPSTLVETLETIADTTHVTFFGTGTGLATRGPDLGGNDFVLLREPRIALVGGPEVSTTDFGALWHFLDQRMKMRFSIISAAQAGGDLRKYNTLILPASGDPRGYERVLGRQGASRLKEWLSTGGTVIAIGSAAAFLADTGSGMSAVRLRQHALKDLPLYSRSVDLEQRADAPVIDSVALWSGKMAVADTARDSKGSPENEKALQVQDERARLFMPRGAILNVELDQEHWLTYGAGVQVPAVIYTPIAFLSKDPVRTPARFSGPSRLRLSGLLWPEARERWARTAYATSESRDRGQIILFADEPNYRGYFEGTTRLLVNAVLLGPGFGTSPPVEW